MRVWVVIPTYNEAANIVPLIREVLKQNEGLEVLVVDDSSPDGTWRLVRAEAGRDPRVHLLLRRGERGRGIAGLEGFREALERGAERLIEMDADFSHDPRIIPAMLRASGEFDLVIGSRYVAGGRDAERGPVRRIVSFCARLYLRRVLGVRVKDPTSGFRCFRASRLRELLEEGPLARGPFIVAELLYRARRRGMKIAEIPIEFHERRAGRSKLGPRILFGYLVRAAKLRLGGAVARYPGPAPSSGLKS